MESHDSYLVFRDAILSVVERYILFNKYLDREELAALLGIALPKKQPAQPDPELEALKRVLTPDYTPTPPPKPEPVKYEALKKASHDADCMRQYPSCQCNTCQKDKLLCCAMHPHKDCPINANDAFSCSCPDYIPEAPHDPLS